MSRMTKQRYEEELYKIRLENLEKKRKQKLKSEKKKYKKKLTLPSTSKLILIGAVLLCLQIILFCEYLMWKTSDLTAMYVLIGIAASLVSVILSYYNKARHENTAGGIVYETAMEKLRNIANIENTQTDDETENNAEVCG